MKFKKSLASFTVLLMLITQTIQVVAQENVQPKPTAPDKSQQEETIRVGTAVVQTEVIVTDKSGRRTPGLKASDFQVLDEGKPQTVDYFTVIESAQLREKTSPETKALAAGEASQPTSTSQPGVAVSPLTIPYEGRHIALVFDDANLTSDNFLRARKAFAEYINTKLTRNDMVALISTSGALASLQQFTNDKQRLLSALNRISAQSSANERARRPRQYISPAEAIRIDSGDSGVLRSVMRRLKVEDPSALEDPKNIGNQQTEIGVSSITSKAGEDRPQSGGDAALESRIRAQSKAIVSETMQNTINSIRTLESLFKGMADLPGRKIAVYLTESFVTAGGTTEDITNAITQLIEVARKSGVSVYSLDAAGLRTNSVSASESVTASGLALRNADVRSTLSSFEEFAGARALVSGTGGEFIANTNSLIDGLERAIQDSSTYYVVGFVPSELDNKFHRLTISIKNRSDLIVRTRKGYLAANTETIRGTEAELAQALKSPVPLLDLPLELVANTVPSPTGEQIVITGLHVGRNYLTLPSATAAEQIASYEVVAYVFAAGRDNPVGGVVRTVTLDLAKDPTIRATLKKDGFIYVPQPFTEIPPGIYQMRAVVREKSTGSVGSAYQFFEVPDNKDRKIITLSGVVLGEAGQTAFDGANSFKPGAGMDVRFIIYNLPKNVTGIVQRIKLIDSQGIALLDSDLPILAPAQGVDRWQSPQATRFNLPLKRGRYALVVTINDAKGKVDVERRTDLVIE